VTTIPIVIEADKLWHKLHIAEQSSQSRPPAPGLSAYPLIAARERKFRDRSLGPEAEEALLNHLIGYQLKITSKGESQCLRGL
jgi:hypothetical protein